MCVCFLFRLCSVDCGGYYSGLAVPVTDRGTSEWKATSSLADKLSQAIVKGVRGRAVKVRVGFREELSKVLIHGVVGPARKCLLQILLSAYFWWVYAVSKGPHPRANLLQHTNLLHVYEPKMNLFCGLCINIRGSEVGSQTCLKTYGNHFIFFSGQGLDAISLYSRSEVSNSHS